jgi:acyl carrier protein
MNNVEPQTTIPTPSVNGTSAGHPSESNETPDGAAAIMLRFQEVMARFLDTQRSVMLSYLGVGGSSIDNGHAALPHNGTARGHQPLPIPAPATTTVNHRLAVAEPIARPLPTPAPVNHSLPAPREPAAAAVAETPVPQGKPAAAAALDRDTLLARLLDLVSDRTGYPKEALSIDLDLEADLGVDSIKRVEILGALAETLETDTAGPQPNLEMEKLSVIKTLRGIADYVTEALASPVLAEPSANGTPKSLAAAERNGEFHPGAREGDVQRLVVRLIDAPLPIRPRVTPPTGTILITDDGRGTAREMADRLADLEIKTALIRVENGEVVPQGTFATDLTDPAAVSELLAVIHEKVGPVSGLIHLLPLAETAEGERADERACREVKSLYLLARGLENEIRDGGKDGGAVLLAVTAMGGRGLYQVPGPRVAGSHRSRGGRGRRNSRDAAGGDAHR